MKQGGILDRASKKDHWVGEGCRGGIGITITAVVSWWGGVGGGHEKKHKEGSEPEKIQ